MADVLTYWERDRLAAAQGVPPCPHCTERDRVERMPNTDPPQWWCDRCRSYLSALAPKSGRAVPDFSATTTEPAYRWLVARNVRRPRRQQREYQTVVADCGRTPVFPTMEAAWAFGHQLGLNRFSVQSLTRPQYERWQALAARDSAQSLPTETLAGLEFTLAKEGR